MHLGVMFLLQVINRIFCMSTNPENPRTSLAPETEELQEKHSEQNPNSRSAQEELNVVNEKRQKYHHRLATLLDAVFFLIFLVIEVALTLAYII